MSVARDALMGAGSRIQQQLEHERGMLRTAHDDANRTRLAHERAQQQVESRRKTIAALIEQQQEIEAAMRTLREAEPSSSEVSDRG